MTQLPNENLPMISTQLLRGYQLEVDYATYPSRVEFAKLLFGQRNRRRQCRVQVCTPEP